MTTEELKCPYCGKEYKSQYFYDEHVKDCDKKPETAEEQVESKAVVEESKDEEETTEEIKVARPKKSEKTTVKSSKSKVKYKEVVYVGTADKSTVKGAVTGKKYEFVKDEYGMPVPIKVDEKDYPGLAALKGKGCVRREPQALFITKVEWDLEVSSAKQSNS